MIKKIIAGIMMVFLINVAIISNSNIAMAQSKGEVPGQTLGLKSDADLWRFVRNGNTGSTQMKDELAAVMIQSEGDNWRALRNGPYFSIWWNWTSWNYWFINCVLSL
jgi:formate dehydrogenase subunit gamma